MAKAGRSRARTIRASICNNSYQSEGTDSFESCAGDLFAPVDGSPGQTERVGDFLIEFSLREDGRPVGAVNAAGTMRTLEPFEFNFSDSADIFHGLWVLTVVNQETLATSSNVAVFFAEESTFSDGTPVRLLETYEGDLGFAYQDASSGLHLTVDLSGRGKLGPAAGSR